MVYYIYKITNKINARYYIGVHYGELDDSYMGSGKALRRAINRYGIENFEKQVLESFHSKEDAYNREKDLVKTVRDDKLSYNLKKGGQGGWDFINDNGFHLGDNNIMRKSAEMREKLSMKGKERFKNDLEYRKKILKNIEKATEASAAANRGRKRPEHSHKLKQYYKDGIMENNLPLRTNSTFKLIDPFGKEYIIDDLSEFCSNAGGPYTSIWKNHESENTVKRGFWKNWKCILLEKGKYEKR